MEPLALEDCAIFLQNLIFRLILVSLNGVKHSANCRLLKLKYNFRKFLFSF